MTDATVSVGEPLNCFYFDIDSGGKAINGQFYTGSMNGALDYVGVI